MAAIKDWIIDMDYYIWLAIESGFTSFEDVLAYVNTYMTPDKDYVYKVLEDYNKGWE